MDKSFIEIFSKFNDIEKMSSSIESEEISKLILEVEKLDTEVGKTIKFKNVLLLNDDKNTEVGNPIIDGATVEAKLLENLLVNVKKCELKWCKIEIIKEKIFVGWVKKTSIWGAVQK